ncbi:glycoside hydrolase family protein [Pantoea sp. Mb-10]|uniref:glycoside hydrolase family protein n=1 Tax=unclassified Pantoea TaxID=2630326 RepID=UPI001E57425B|nr:MULTISPECIES: glycoside hydrolase family protein [unclassified Pantoea]MCE0489009.1 glycoside hydrolase family protein [Pantoea sp. Mb-10]MCE0503635.1 glycoside hydrolase family protein [Pantoea sp. Pb-8]
MSQVIAILNFEEGYRETPYLDTEGFPTVAGGIRIGPKGAALSHYIFRVPRKVGDIWKQCLVDETLAQMQQRPLIQQALTRCNEARCDVLVSMAYQLGVEGLALFRSMLTAITQDDFNAAANAMLDSRWAVQTPGRVRRHAEAMRSGNYDIYRGLL